MVRRLLTEEFVDSLVAPATGEVWIADTQVRGFGIRLWASRSNPGKVFSIRTPDKQGRSVRKAFRPFLDGRPIRLWALNDDDRLFEPDGQFRLAAFLDCARSWARAEINQIRGRVPSNAEQDLLDAERDTTLALSGARLRQHTLGRLVEITLESGHARGWTEQYRDRLRHAFNQFDPDDSIRSLRIAEISDGQLLSFVEHSRLSPGNFRLLRSLFNVIFCNLHLLGGPPIGHVLPNRMFAPDTENENVDDFLNNFSRQQMEQLFHFLRESNADWRARSAIALSCLFWAPVSRVLRARWSEIIDDEWYPFKPGDQRYWWAKSSRIRRPALEWFQFARQMAGSECLSSDFWFPSQMHPDRAITNIDRTWRQALDALNWPNVSLTKLGRTSRKRLHFFEWPDGFGDPNPHGSMERARAEICQQLLAFPGVRSSKLDSD